MIDTTTLPSTSHPADTAAAAAGARAPSDAPAHRSMTRRLAAGLAGWALGAFAAAAAGLLDRLPAPAVPALIGGSAAGFALVYALSPALRAWARAADVRAMIALHAVRAPIGLAFLALCARGRLPAEFAVRAGWGDIAVGLTAPLAALAAGGLARSPARARAVFAWNALALADIAVAVATAQRLLLVAHEPRMVGTLGRFPFVLVPALVVPLVLITHALVFVRLRHAARGAAAG